MKCFHVASCDQMISCGPQKTSVSSVHLWHHLVDKRTFILLYCCVIDHLHWQPLKLQNETNVLLQIEWNFVSPDSTHQSMLIYWLNNCYFVFYIHILVLGYALESGFDWSCSIGLYFSIPEEIILYIPDSQLILTKDPRQRPKDICNIQTSCYYRPTATVQQWNSLEHTVAVQLWHWLTSYLL